MAFVLDVVLQGEGAVNAALRKIEDHLKNVEKRADSFTDHVNQAVEKIGVDYANASTKAAVASGQLTKQMKAQWEATQKANMVLADRVKQLQLEHRASNSYRDGLKKQIELLNRSQISYASVAEAELKLTEQQVKLRAQLEVYNGSLAKNVRALEAQLKAAKAAEDAERKRSQRVKELTAELGRLERGEATAALRLEQQIKLAKEAAVEDQKRAAKLRAMEAELQRLSTSEGKQAELLAHRIKLAKEAAVEDEKRAAKLKGLVSAYQHLATPEGQAAVLMEQRIKLAKEAILQDEKRAANLSKLRKSLEEISTSEGKQAESLAFQIKLAKEAAVEDQKRTARMQALSKELERLGTAEGKEATLLEHKIKLAKEAAVEDQKRTARMQALSKELERLGTAEGKEATLLEHKIKLAKEAAVEDQKRTARMQALSKELERLGTEEGKEATLLEHKIKLAKEAAVVEEKRAAKLRALASELDYLRTAEGKQQTELEKAIAQQKRLGEEDLKRKNRLADLRNEMNFLLSAQGRQTAAAEENLKWAKQVAVEDQRRANKLRDLRAELNYVESAEGKRAASLQAQIAASRTAATVEQNRLAGIAKVREELESLRNGTQRTLEVEKARLALQKQLIKQEFEQQAALDKSNAALKHFDAQKERDIQLNKVMLAQLKEQAKADAEAEARKRGIVRETDRHAESIKRLREELAWLNTAQGKQYLADKQVEAQLKKQVAALHNVEAATRKARNETAKFANALGLANQAGATMRASMAGFGATFGMFTSSTILAATAAYAVSSSLREALRAGVEFESQMDRVNAIMDASGTNSVRLEQEVRHLAETTVFTAREVSDGLMYLGMAGLKTEDALTALQPSLRLASIGMLDMGTTADIVTNIMVGMGLQAEDISGIVDDMATAITNSNMDIQQLGNAMSYVAPLAREADISLQEVVASLEVLHNSGIKASRAGTAMRTSMLALLAPTAEAMNVLMAYGIEVDDHTGRMRNWTELLGDMANAQMTLADIEAIVGKRQAAGMKTMIDSAKATEEWTKKAKDAGYESAKTGSQLQYLTEQLHRNSGAAATMQAVMEDNLRGDWLKLISALEEKFLEFYDMNKEQLRYMVVNATEFVKSLDVEEVHNYFHTLLDYLKQGAELLALYKGFSLGWSMSQAGVYGGAAMAASIAGMADWYGSRRGKNNGPSGAVTPTSAGVSSTIVDRRGNPISYESSKPYRDVKMTSVLNYGSMLVPGVGWANGARTAATGLYNAGRVIAPAALQVGLPLAGAYAAHSIYSSGSDAVSGITGDALSAEEAYFQNRLRQYSAMANNELLLTQQNMEQSIANASEMIRQAQASYEENVLLGNQEAAEENLKFIDQMIEKIMELAANLNILGVARENSGMFGSMAEAEVAYKNAQTQYETAVTNRQTYENLPDSVKTQPEIQQTITRLAQEELEAKNELLRVAGELDRIQQIKLEREGKIKAEQQQQGSIVAEQAVNLKRQLDIEEGLVTTSDLLAENRRQQKQLDESKLGILLKTVSQEDLLLMSRRDVHNMSKEELDRQQALYDKHGEILGSANEAKHIAQQKLKLTAEENQLLQRQRQENERITAQKQRNISLTERANAQAAQALEQAKQRREQIEDQFLVVEYMNDAYEQGILLLDDEEYRRKRAIEQQERQVQLAKDALADAIKKGEADEDGLRDLALRIKEEEKVLELLGRQKAEISEARRFAEQQYQSLSQMYSTIESETIGLLERGFRDSQSYFDSVVGSFKRMLAELAYQAAIKPIIVNMVASMGNMMGMGKASQAWAADQGVTVGGGFGNLASMGKSAWNFWKGGGQADVSWFNDFAKSGFGTALGLSTAATTAGGYSAFAAAMPNTAGYLGMGVNTSTSGLIGLGGTATQTAGTVGAGGAASLTGAGSFLSRGLSYSPWGAVGAIGANLMGLQGSGNFLIDTALQTGGSIVGAGIGSSIGALGAFGGPIGAIAGSVLGAALGGLFGGDKSYRTRGSIGFTENENNRFLYGGGNQHETYRKESAFGWNHLHINKYGNVNDYKQVIDQIVETDNALAGSMSQKQIDDAASALNGWSRGGKRGDQNNLGNFALQRYDVLMRAADVEIFRLAKKYGGGSLSEDIKSFSALNLINRSGQGPENLAMYAGMMPGTSFADTASLVETAYQVFRQLPNMKEQFLPFREAMAFGNVNKQTLAGRFAGSNTAGSALAGYADLGDASRLEQNTLNTWAKSVNAVVADMRSVGKTTSEIAAFLVTAMDDFESLGDIAGRALAANASHYIQHNYAREGESAGETNARVLEGFSVLSKAFNNFGHEVNLYSLALLDVTESIVEFSGGLDSLKANLEAYYQGFYSEEERLANTMADITRQLANLDMTLPDTREGFRELVDSVDKTKKSGQEQYAQLLAMSGLMSQYYGQIEQWTSQITQAYAQIYGHTPDSAFLDEWISKLKSGTITLSELLENMIGAIAGSTPELDAAYAGVAAAANVAYQTYRESMSLAEESYRLAVEKLNLERQFVDQLQSTLSNLQYSDLSVMTPEQKLLAAQADYSAALQSVQDGDLSKSGDLQSAAQRYLEYASGFYSSSDTYKQIYASVFGALKSLEIEYGAKVEDSQQAAEDRFADEQKRAADVLEAQLSEIVAQHEAVNSIREVLIQLPGQLASAVAEALNTDYSGVAYSADGVRLEGVSGSIVDAFLENTNSRPDALSAYYWQRQLDKGTSIEDIITQIRDGNGFINGSHFGGLTSVPYDGYVAKLHKGEQVIPASRVGSSESSDLVRELRELRKEVRELREENAKNAQLLAQANYDASDRAADKINTGAELIAKQRDADAQQVNLR